ncbi:Gfo/Idh/MocA family oxidoreductase [Pedobacter heparinus]|uniref:Gfo/Idh/MocA family protein n=1 Tax=Pedobacter heparinus TaxID=984 RepID=UPI0029312336|nr:Gfo/Idh/MocA family oxidoreductase [Pedobacter heparinus]
MPKIAMLGAGFIGQFYADALHGQRGRDRISVVYSRTEETAVNFAKKYDVAHWTTSMEEAIHHEETEIVIISLPNNLHEAAVLACAKAGKGVLCTKPLGRNAQEAKRMLDAVEKAGIFHGYLEDLCYTPKFLKANHSVHQGSLGRILWVRSREAHNGPHSDWFWNKDKSGGGAILDLGCHCIEIARNFIGKKVKPVEVMCWAATQVKPIDAEDHAIGLVKYENGAVGQFEVSWNFRGGMDLRDEVMGTEGTIWINNFLRTGFEMFSGVQGEGYIAEKAETNTGWLFPVGDEVHELGYTNMFTDMFNAFENGSSPQEDFYDGFIVNEIMDAALKSVESKQWELINLQLWKGEESVRVGDNSIDYDEDYYLIKEEKLPDGTTKVILKSKETGEVIRRTV